MFLVYISVNAESSTQVEKDDKIAVARWGVWKENRVIGVQVFLNQIPSICISILTCI